MSPLERDRSPTLVVGSGFIGSHVAVGLARAGISTLVLTRSKPSDEVITAVGAENVTVADASDAGAVRTAAGRTERIVYCAGGLMPSSSELDPLRDFTLTIPPLIAVLDAAVHAESPVTLISSGGTVYGLPTMDPVPEEHPTQPINAYGVVKLTVEKIAEMYARRHSLPATILRCSNVYGDRQPWDRGQGIVPTFLHRLLTGDPLIVFGDGSVVRDYVFVHDVVGVLLALPPLDGGIRILNVGSGHATSLNEAIATMERVTGESATVARHPPRRFDIPSIVLDIGRLRQLVEYQPTSFREGVQRTWEWVLQHQESP